MLIPTYNNAGTLDRVIFDVLQFTSHIIVVNDGSTDDTRDILAKFDEIEVISFAANRGKGVALKHGFQAAEKLGFEYAISMDSDGQHFADDLPVFLKRLEEKEANDPGLLLIGTREMSDASVPKKSSFGNKFSNFWFWVETGIKLTDTQCGFRLYPLKVIKHIPLYTKRFEFEIEVIVKAAWRKIAVENVPVKVHYASENRVSHFRPLQDFSRISILNTYLVFMAFFYIGPRNKFINFRKKGFKRFWQEDVLKSDETPFQKAKAVALGIFFGIAPFWGFQTILVLLTARAFHLNKLIAFLFSNISIPPFIPLIAYASYQIGAITLGKTPDWSLHINGMITGIDILKSMWQYVLGSFVLATLLSFVFGIFFYFLFSVFKSNKK